jgi:CCR4-NOT transcription complex subunit 1
MDSLFPGGGGLDGGLFSTGGIADRMAAADAISAVSNLLADVGPACTQNEATFRETLAEMLPGGMNEAVMARILYFFSSKSKKALSMDSLSSSLLGSILPGSYNDASEIGWSLPVVSSVIRRDYSATVDWAQVAIKWDFFDFNLLSTEQFQTLLQLYQAGAMANPPLAALTYQWAHAAGQTSLLEAMLTVPPTVYLCELSEAELADAETSSGQGSSAPNPRCWASAAVLQRLLYLSDIPTLARRVRDLFVKGLLGCPEVLLCALVRLQLTGAPSGGHQMKGELMRELIPLFFKPNSNHRVQNGPAALRRLWAISPNTVTAACIEAWKSTASEAPQARLGTIIHIIQIVRLLPSPETAIASLLNGSKDPEFSLAVAFVMADKNILQLKPWLTERISSSGVLFAGALVAYLAKTYPTAAPRDSSVLVSLENMLISLQILHCLDATLLQQTIPTEGQAMTLLDSIKSLTEACASTHPSIRATLIQSLQQQQQHNSTPSQQKSSSNDDDIDEMANSYFQKIYTSEQSIGEVVDMLKRFKTSGDSRENEIFACMIRNLFDEYRFFSKYPEKELRITGILFGTLIKEQLVNSITLGIALRYVLEALRRPPSPPGSTTSSSGKMFRFGMFALEQFKDRLHEWPQYCSHIVQIPHLKDGYAELVGEIETAMLESQSRTPQQAGPSDGASIAGSSIDGDRSRASGSVMSATPPNRFPNGSASIQSRDTVIPIPRPDPVENRTPVFGPKLGRAVNNKVDVEVQHEAPPDAVLDRVQFLINNISPSNVEAKSGELREMLKPQYFDWLGHYLVVKRISAQPNFHSLYLAFLDHLGEYGRGLIVSILSSVYLNIGKLLRSPKITTSTSERSLLKNLGSWLGQITIARNRPILQIMLDCKELLFQGYENGMLIAVTPFVAKILEGAKNSVVFRPPNPWVMGLLGVFRALYQVDDLKMNIKFEVEVLCKNLNIKLEEIDPRTSALALRIKPVKEKNPDFNMKSSMVAAAPAAPAAPAAIPLPAGPVLGSPESKSLSNGSLPQPAIPVSASGAPAKASDQQTVIPNLAAYVTINPSLALLVQQSSGSVVSAALITALSTATLKKAVPIAVDRAIREIIQPVVERSVTIACITTKEIVTKDFATEGDENKTRKAAQLMVANLAGSLALVTCRDPLRTSVSTHLRQLLVSSAGGTEKLTEQEQAIIEQCVAVCASDNLELGCMLIEKAATEKAVRDVDEALAQVLAARRKHREQTGGQPYYDMAVLGNGNQRYPGALPEPLRPKPGGLRPEQLRVYEAFQRMPRQPTAGGFGSSGIPQSRSSGNLEGENQGGQQLNLEVLQTIAAKMDSSVSMLLSSTGPRAAEVTFSMLPADHDVRKLLAAVPQVVPPNLTQTEKEAVLSFSQSVFKRLYELRLTEPLRLEALVALLEKINGSCPQLGKDLGTWATYAPTETEAQKKLHRTVLLLLVRSSLVSTQELDSFLCASADNGRNPVWVEFSLLFIRTAFLERIAAPSDFPKLMDLMTKIVEGRSQADPQVSQTLRKPILRMLDEVRGSSGGKEPQNRAVAPAATPEPRCATLESSSSLSAASLISFSNGSKNGAESLLRFASKDPANAKQQVTFLLDSWIRVHGEAASNEKVLAQYLQLLQQSGVGKSEEQTERFFRLATQIVVEAVMKTSNGGDSNGTVLNYTVIDIYAKLFPLQFKYLNVNGTEEQITVQRVSLLNKILGAVMRCMMFDFEKNKKQGLKPWDQRPWYRLLLNITVDMNSPDPMFDSIQNSILAVFGGAFHVSQPLVMPGFAFAWLELVSHRIFLPNLMLLKGQKGWGVAHQLLVDLFLFLEPHLGKTEMGVAIKKLYEGTLRVLLLLLHDFPSFLAGYHLSLCNILPENCVQLRNVILSAVPKGITLPDPFTPNLKIDSLVEISQNPVVLSNVVGPIEAMRAGLDDFLKGERGDFLAGLLQRLRKGSTNDLDAPRINSLVLYVGIQAISRLQNAQIQSLANTPELEILQKLMELDDHGRYISLNAIANQLRYPSSHSHYFSCVMLFLFSESKSAAVNEQITRVLLERLILHRPHPVSICHMPAYLFCKACFLFLTLPYTLLLQWGLLITFIELIKNQRYQFWSHPFTRCATEIEKVFESVARSCMAPGTQRSALIGGGDVAQ